MEPPSVLFSRVYQNQNRGLYFSRAHLLVIARVEAILLSDGWLQGGHDESGSGKAAGY